MRANLDGSQVETLVETGRGDDDRRDQTRWCVGITIDPERGQIYWTQKGPDNGEPGPHLPRRHRHPQGRDRRQSHRHRSASSTICRSRSTSSSISKIASSTGPIAATLRAATRSIAPPIDAQAGKRRRSLVTHLMEGIGIALDVPGDRMFVTDFAGSVYSAKLDGSRRAQLSLRAGQSHRHRLRRNLKSDRRRTDHVQQQAYSPSRHHRNGRHRRELDGTVPGEGTGCRRDRYRAECGERR